MTHVSVSTLEKPQLLKDTAVLSETVITGSAKFTPEGEQYGGISRHKYILLTAVV